MNLLLYCMLHTNILYGGGSTDTNTFGSLKLKQLEVHKHFNAVRDEEMNRGGYGLVPTTASLFTSLFCTFLCVTPGCTSKCKQTNFLCPPGTNSIVGFNVDTLGANSICQYFMCFRDECSWKRQVF